MARGHQKIQAQAKANEAAAKRKKQEGHSSADSKKTAAAGLKASCSVCKVRRDKKCIFCGSYESGNTHSAEMGTGF